MKKFLMAFCTIILCGRIIAAPACTQNEIDILGNGTQCETAKFEITTTELSADTTFAFYMSAKGIFYVDWGDGTVDTIPRNDTTATLYDHTYTTAGVKTIRFGGLATGYNTDGGTAAIRFGYGSATETDDATPTLIESISGSLGAIFSTLGQTSGTQPVFGWSFATATHISHIPENLFAGVTGGRRSMFAHTFYRCYALEDIPEHLFANITAAGWMFQSTFAGCVRLTSIPETLFENITFCETGMFYATFVDCQQVTKIPERLFANITSVSGASVFEGTFKGCSALSGYIPPSTFAGLIANGSPVTGNMWGDAFTSTKLATSCPSGKMPYFTGYESYWAGKVSCQDIVPVTCDAGEYFSATDARCHVCTNDNYCPGGTYTYNGNDMGKISCNTGLFAPAGMWEAAQCGRILHVGDGFVYLRATKKTSPSLHLDLDHDGVADYFGNMTTLDVPMSRDTQRKLKVRYNNITYSIYDDSVDLSLYE